jgi:hypothetical protein
METASPLPGHAWPFPFPAQDWGQTPPSVQAYVLQLQHDLRHLSARVEAIEARFDAMAVPSDRPPSSDRLSKKARQRSTTPPRNAGGRPGRPGLRQRSVQNSSRSLESAETRQGENFLRVDFGLSSRTIS